LASKEQMLAYLLVGILRMLGKMHDWTLLAKWRGIQHSKIECLKRMLIRPVSGLGAGLAA